MNRLVIVCALCLLAGIVRADEPAGSNPQSTDAPVQVRDYGSLANILADGASDERFLFAVSDFASANGLGIDVAEPDAALRAQLSLASGEGLTVTSVPAESAGAKAGIAVHDILLEVGGQKVGTPADLNGHLNAADGQSVKIKLRRAGKTLELAATPQKPHFARLRLSRYLTADLHDATLAATESFRIGVTLSAADDTLRQQLRLAAGEGLVVTEVLPETPAAQAGIQVHDVLTVLDGKRLTTVEAVNAQIQEIKERAVELRLLRGGHEQTLSITPVKTPEAAFIDRPLTVWNTQSCARCHADPHAGMAHNLGADTSVWLDGHTARIYRHNLANAVTLRLAHDLSASDKPAPQQQIESLKKQLGEMQQTLAALEAALADPAQAEPSQSDAQKNEPEQSAPETKEK
jgi:membrane-associated protease RseP (regulator of RpoE activity)